MRLIKSWPYKLLTLFFVFPFLALAQTEPESAETENDTTANKAARAAFDLMNNVATGTQDRIETATSDSTQADSTISPSVLQNLVNYYAKDSMPVDVQQNKAFLYNEAHIDYGNISLDAGYIELNWETNEVYATGILDSNGEMTQTPIFKQGEDTYRTDEMRYNFSSNKAIIKSVVTREGESFLHGEVIKRQDENTFYVKGTAFTTCNKEHPHFYVSAKKAKVIVGDKIITGAANLKVADIPTPVLLPFGMFPAQDKRASGFIIPTFNSHIGKGYGLVNGGYYFALSDYYDLKLTGEIYSRGGWGVRAETNYKKRYRYSGNFYARYNRTLIGDARYEDYGTEFIDSRDFSIFWRHEQDPKARPDLRFAASVDLKNPTFNRYNSQSMNNYMQNTTVSSVSLDKRFVGTPFSLTASARQSQNNISKDFDLSLPKVAFNMTRINPFQRKDRVGSAKWYERIGTTYSLNTEANMKANYDSLSNDAQTFENTLRYGMSHNVAVSTNERVLKFFSLNPSLRYTSKWYTSHLEYRYDQNGDVVSDTVNGFSATNEIRGALDLSTKVYGTFLFRKGKVKAIRHMVTPSVGLSYSPDYTDGFWGNYQTLVDSTGEERYYDKYSGYLYGGSSVGQNGSVNFRLNNNLEMKTRSEKDSTGERKVKILDRLNASTSYNMFAEEFQWQPLSVNAQSSILKNKVQLTYQGNFDFYGYSKVLDERVNKSAWEVNGKLMRNTRSNFSVNMGWSGTLGGEREKKENKSVLGLEGEDPNYYKVENYMAFSMPWQFSINYNYQITKPDLESVISTHAIGINGTFDPTPNWHVQLSTGYDLVAKDITPSEINIVRDLHCWEIRLRWVPFGFNRSYMIGINIKASSFKDAKLERRRNQGDF